MDAATLSAVMGASLPIARYEELLPSVESAMRAVGATSPRAAAVFLAQIGHESVGLRYDTEIADGTAYEGRGDLGNIYPGDGQRFRGRGWIQVTGRHNYTACSAWAYSRGIVPTDTWFVDHPEDLARDDLVWVGPVWYWTHARPQLVGMADAGDIVGSTRAINGGLNGLEDRRARYERALTMGDRILPGRKAKMTEKVLDYPRDQVVQDTGYFCGPASTQTVVRAATGRLISEGDLARELGTTTEGTDWIGQFPAVLNRHIPGAGYVHREMPHDPPSAAQVEQLWADIVGSIDGGHGVVANIVAPPSNYPRAVEPSTVSPAYRGGTVYHYIALMGYADDERGRRVWVADSGFAPYGYWIGFAQLASLIPPKGYAYAITPRDDKEQDMTDDTRRVLEVALDNQRQLRGPQLRGWAQLGKNAAGDDLTLVDAVAALRHDIARLTEKLANLGGK